MNEYMELFEQLLPLIEQLMIDAGRFAVRPQADSPQGAHSGG
jgi:hypothetical protein